MMVLSGIVLGHLMVKTHVIYDTAVNHGWEQDNRIRKSHSWRSSICGVGFPVGSRPFPALIEAHSSGSERGLYNHQKFSLARLAA
jgi:hypothetical protein